MSDTTRRFPRTLRAAFPWVEQTETAIGINGPIVTPQWPIWVRALRWIFNL